jgi:hypothetical protein
MNAIAKHWKNDREGAIALLVLVGIILLYLTAMIIWIVYEWNKPLKEYRVYDFGGHALALQLSRKIYRKLFHKDKG